MTAARKARSRRAPLSYELVIETALNLADEVGIDALSMRRLGQALGVEAMSLYNHVANKEALLDGLVDRVFSEMQLAEKTGEWKSGMRACAVSKHEALRRHPWATVLLESRTNPGPENLKHHDAVLGCLRNAGFSIVDAVHAYSAMDSYVYGFAMQQANLPFDSPEEMHHVTEMMMSAMPVGEYPHLAEAGIELVRMQYDYGQEFEYGLDLILDGIEREGSPG